MKVFKLIDVIKDIKAKMTQNSPAPNDYGILTVYSCPEKYTNHY